MSDKLLASNNNEMSASASETATNVGLVRVICALFGRNLPLAGEKRPLFPFSSRLLRTTPPGERRVYPLFGVSTALRGDKSKFDLSGNDYSFCMVTGSGRSSALPCFRKSIAFVLSMARR